MTFIRRLSKGKSVYLYRVTNHREKGSNKVKQVSLNSVKKTIDIYIYNTCEGFKAFLPNMQERMNDLLTVKGRECGGILTALNS